jgi:hypothetical protein
LAEERSPGLRLLAEEHSDRGFNRESQLSRLE